MINTSISFQNVTEIEIKEINTFEKDSEIDTFYTRYINVTDSNGNTIQLTFFSDKKSVLKFI
jgi:hypothetical protein